MENEALQPITRPRFFEVCQQYHLDSQMMHQIAKQANVPKEVVNAMSVGIAVHRKRAVSVLSALSKYTGDTWTLDTVQVTLLHTFQEFHAFHEFDLSLLSILSGVSFDTIGMMLRAEPVTMREARLVLQAASRQSCISYRITNVDVPLIDGDNS